MALLWLPKIQLPGQTIWACNMQQDGILASVIYQQDGAPPHYANIVRGYLNDTFTNRWIGIAADRMWAPSSPDLVLLDYFAWGFIKSRVYASRVPHLNEMKQRIREACLLIPLKFYCACSAQPQGDGNSVFTMKVDMSNFIRPSYLNITFILL